MKSYIFTILASLSIFCANGQTMRITTTDGQTFNYDTKKISLVEILPTNEEPEPEKPAYNYEELLTVSLDEEDFNYHRAYNVLIEKYEGWKCVNCPTLDSFIEETLVPQYPINLLSLHMTSNAFSSGHPDGFDIDLADSLAVMCIENENPYSLGLPTCLVNRHSPISDTHEIEEDIINETTMHEKGQKAAIWLASNLKKTNDSCYAISVLVDYNDAFHVENIDNSDFYVQAFVVEDVISRMQQSYSGYIRNYQNTNVLQQNVFENLEGMPVFYNPEASGKYSVIKNSFTIDTEKINVENSHILIVLYKRSTKEVYNSLLVKMVE